MSYIDVLNMVEYGTTRIFKDIKAGDLVFFKDRSWNRASGKANALLLFPDHVVVNIGGRHGTPMVVNEANYISHRGVKRNA